MGDVAWIVGATAVMVVVGWFGARRSGGGRAGTQDRDAVADPNAADEDGFTPADKYGYGYDYSWGDPYGDPDL